MALAWCLVVTDSEQSSVGDDFEDDAVLAGAKAHAAGSQLRFALDGGSRSAIRVARQLLQHLHFLGHIERFSDNQRIKSVCRSDECLRRRFINCGLFWSTDPLRNMQY